jgi:hypothetical protein
MFSLHLALALGWLASGNAPPAPIGLSSVPRSVAKEPAYRSAPRYALLVFGPQAKFRVWLAFDGDTLYIDRNGNGDLTDPGERFEPSEEPVENAMNRGTSYEVGTLEDPFTKVAYSGVRVQRVAIRPGYTPRTEEEKAGFAKLRARDPEYEIGGMVRIFVQSGGKVTQFGTPRCSTRPAEANILHFDGPLSFHLVEIDGCEVRLGDKPTDFRVELVTPGLGRFANTIVGHEIVPEGVAPVAEFEFPSGKPGGPAIKAKYSLTGRC